MEIRAYREGLLGEWARYWRDAFSGMRNYLPVTEELLRTRIVEKRTGLERFEPEDLLFATEGGRIVGAIHVGTRSETFCRAAFPGWAGGAQGYVAFLHVLPTHRRRGIGGELWRRGLARIEEAGAPVVDGQNLNPYYGNSEGPFPALWGTPEGIGILRGDAETQRFLAKRGHRPRYEGVQLEWRPESSSGPSVEEVRAEQEAKGVEIVLDSAFYPEPGSMYGLRARYPERYEATCVCAVRDRRVLGVLSFFPLSGVESNAYAVYELLVEDAARGQGIGSALARAAVATLRSLGAKRCDALTLPELSPSAVALYEGVGFRQVERWAVY